MVVAESSARYLAPARFDQDINIEVVLERLTESSMTTVHTFRHDDHLLAVGRVRHVCVDQDSWTTTPWPDAVRTAFAPLLAGPT